MNPDELLAAVRTLAACDHFDNSRRAARTLPNDFPVLDLLRAADGATRLARDLNENQRTSR